ncbi:7TM diverse intracellular signaling domain-containing protein [Bernardetia sp. MNP-M8]|uniref:7TM diverse intracellular signaling domain-containing protein n=1 Tax=Bernardetia sp. MNP-M8 TaxID=3127470 RepID=UPI0030CAF46F
MRNREYNYYKIYVQLCIVVFLICIPVFFVKAQKNKANSFQDKSFEKIWLSSQQEKLIISSSSQIAEDKTGFLSIQQAIKSLNFENSKEAKPNFGYTSSTYWCRFQIENATNNSQNRWLEIQYPLLDSVWLYEVDSAQNIIQVQLLGDKMPYTQREIKDADLIFVLNINPRKTTTYYMRCRTQGTMTFPLVLWQPQAFSEQTANDRFGFGIYYGIIVVMIFYNLFIFFSLRDRAYLYYVLTIASIALFQLAFNGLGFQYLWSNFYPFNDIAIPFSISCFSFISLLFARQFLHLKKLLPKTDKLVLVFVALIIIELSLTFFLPYKVMIKVSSITGVVATTLLFYMGVMSYRRGYKSAIYFLIAWSLFWLGILCSIFKGFGLLSTNFITTYAIQIGSALEVILLSLGLADRINMLKNQLAEKTITEKNQKIENEIRQRYLIESQNQKLEQLVAERTVDLEQKTIELQSQNQKITDSLKYAKRIQDAILPPKEERDTILENHFVFFKPKDIVSGDFYWISEHKKEQKIIVAAVDCTGHGVPGAFMSIIGNNLLNQIINEKNIFYPSDILEELHKGVRTILKQDYDSSSNLNTSRDGMDIALCVINREKHTLEFAGANRPLWIVKNGKFEEIKGDRRAIGGWQNEQKREFKTHSIDLNEEMNVYLSSDGYSDQFGGNNEEGKEQTSKKFMSKNFKKLLVDINNTERTSQNLETQCSTLEQVMEKWKGNEPQIDDVLVVGFAVSKG